MTTARTPRTAAAYYRLGLVVAVATALFLLFGIGALGIIGPGGPPDLLYVGALAVAVTGALVTRFRAGGMARSLALAALATLLAGVVAIAAGLHRTDGASVAEILMLSVMYAVLFGASAWLFRSAHTRSGHIRSAHTRFGHRGGDAL